LNPLVIANLDAQVPPEQMDDPEVLGQVPRPADRVL